MKKVTFLLCLISIFTGAILAQDADDSAVIQADIFVDLNGIAELDDQMFITFVEYMQYQGVWSSLSIIYQDTIQARADKYKKLVDGGSRDFQDHQYLNTFLSLQGNAEMALDYMLLAAERFKKVNHAMIATSSAIDAGLKQHALKAAKMVEKIEPSYRFFEETIVNYYKFSEVKKPVEAPNFNAKLPSGEFELRSYKKPVVILFFSTRDYMRDAIRFYNLCNRSIKVIGICTTPKNDQTTSFMTDTNPSFEIIYLHDDVDKHGLMLADYGAYTVPMVCIIDSSGDLVKYQASPQVLLAYIEENKK